MFSPSRRTLLRGAVAAPLVLLRRPALAAPQSLILRRGLGYPGGMLRPGFNPNHVAAQGISSHHGFSAVPQGSTFVNLLNGAVGANSGGTLPVGQTIPIIGPSVFYDNSGITAFTGQAAVADNVGTVGVILLATGFVQGAAFGSDVSGGNGGYELATAGTGTAQFFAQFAGGQRTGNFPPLSVNVPYFLAYSGGGASYTTNFVQVNLINGQMLLATDNPGGTSVASGGSYTIGGAGTSFNKWFGNIGPVMYGPGYMTLKQLAVWGADAWSFWYPTTPQVAAFDAELVGHSAGAAPAASFLSLPMMGVGP